jgi:hypothetical protein
MRLARSSTLLPDMMPWLADTGGTDFLASGLGNIWALKGRPSPTTNHLGFSTIKEENKKASKSGMCSRPSLKFSSTLDPVAIPRV